MSEDNNESDDEVKFENRDEALEKLEDMRGQAVVEADTAYEYLRHFPELWDGEVYELQVDIAEESNTALDENIITSIPLWTPVMPVESVSRILVEKMGGEPSEASYGGTGYTYDARHDVNMKKIRELLDDEESDE